MVHKPRTTAKECFWYYGETGLGKSRKAWADHPTAFPKMCNKWWDGYQGEKVVIIDDIDDSHRSLGYDIKKWADPWIRFTAEEKGGAQPPDFDILIVTSNFHPNEIWQDKRILDPILRRFKVTHFLQPLQPSAPQGSELEAPNSQRVLED